MSYSSPARFIAFRRFFSPRRRNVSRVGRRNEVTLGLGPSPKCIRNLQVLKLYLEPISGLVRQALKSALFEANQEFSLELSP
ncbi:hypothetical protein BHE74_00019251 [Ensete ventricosum]|nr:hypothetical protein GW17_00022214 [Ensete ventricosum]RWW72907.1 hypothetical protein BHE74_00019251 [Ensete ventricosum]